MNRTEILAWLRETDDARLADLWQRADQTRQQYVGGEVHLRGLIELSNYCIRKCAYCGLRAENAGLQRYRMSVDEVMQCAADAVEYGYGTVVLQSGEDPGLTADWMAALVRRIKAETPLAVTLSLGERDEDELAAWRAAGADRYLLRFETSNPRLYGRIHPPRPGGRPDRFALLKALRQLGYEVGSGVMIGIPEQTYEDLATDIELFAAMDLDMIGVGPYIVHPNTPLGANGGLGTGGSGLGTRHSEFGVQGSGFRVQDSNTTVTAHLESRVPSPEPPVPSPQSPAPIPDQVPGDELTTYKVIALSRLVCPRANIPATTALATLNRDRGRELGLVRGANVIMPNLTPTKYRVLYEIYPNKACMVETAEACSDCLDARIRAIGRTPGSGRGDSLSYGKRVAGLPLECGDPSPLSKGPQAPRNASIPL